MKKAEFVFFLCFIGLRSNLVDCITCNCVCLDCVKSIASHQYYLKIFTLLWITYLKIILYRCTFYHNDFVRVLEI